MPKNKVAILEDNEDIRNLITINLHKNNFKAFKYSNANSFFKDIDENIPDLLILDLMLPDMDGLEVCKKLRAHKKFANLPIIMLTAKSEEMDKIVGLEIGADDYMTKPFSPRELIARIKAVLRRSNDDQQEEELIKIGDDLKINLHKFTVHVGKIPVKLTTTEFKILALLAKKKGWVYSRNKILDYLYGSEKMVMDRTIDVHIRNLRKKLNKAGEHIKNIRGVGYKIVE